MNAKLLLIVSCLLISTTISAEIRTHWVVGSFKAEYYALKEVERIREMVGLECQLVPATVNGQQVFRLVTEKPASAPAQAEVKAALAAIGIEGVWNLDHSLSDQTMIARSGADYQKAKVTPAPAPAPVPAPAPAPAPKTFKPKVVSTEPPFAADNQSYVDFCINKATAAQRRLYCGNQQFSEGARKELSPDEQKLVQRSKL